MTEQHKEEDQQELEKPVEEEKKASVIPVADCPAVVAP